MSAAHPLRRNAFDDAARLLQLHLRRHAADLGPDPLFGRRLRGELLNRHVATREGTAPVAVPARPEMGRLGRACLYASVLVASGVGGTMAASQGALPGDALYPVKLELEQLRLQALPVEHHDDLATAMLAERVWELGMLVEAGNDAAAAAMAAPIQDAIERLAAQGLAMPAGSAPTSPQLEVLQGLIDRLPAAAEAVIEQRIDDAAARESEKNGHAPVRDRVTDEGGSAPNDRGLINRPGKSTADPPARSGGAEWAPGQVRDDTPPEAIDTVEPDD